MAKAINIVVSGNAAPLRKALSQTQNDLNAFSSKARSLLLPAAAALGGLAFAANGAVQAAADLGETTSKAGVLFGQAQKQIVAFSKTTASSLGLSRKAALDATTSFAVFGKSAGLTGRQLADFSIDFTKLAGDLASFNNTSPEEAIVAIGAALRGEAEPIRKYGVLLDDATLRQKALELGIISTTKQALTPQQKVLAAQAAIFEQTSDAQGDFERTSDSLANRQKVLAAELENVKIIIGEALLPIASTIVTFIQEKFIPFVQRLADAFSEDGLSGAIKEAWQAFSDFAEDADGWKGAILDLALSLGVLFGAIKALTIIGTITGLVGSLGGALSGLGGIIPGLAGMGAAGLGTLAGAVALVAGSVYVLISALRDPIFREEFGVVLLNSLKLIGNTFIGLYNIIATGLNGIYAGARTAINGAVRIVNILNPFQDVPKLPESILPILDFYSFNLGAPPREPSSIPLPAPSPRQSTIPLMANGGIVRARPGGTLAILGEGGRDEAVVPLGAGGIGATYNITVQTGVGDAREIGRQIVEYIQKFERTAGQVFASA